LEEKTRQEEIRDKGFDFATPTETQYGKIRLGVRTLEDAVLNLGALKSANRRLASKEMVLRALAENDLATLREISHFFFRTSGIYQKACNHFATMYRHDWYIAPEVYDETVKEEKVLVEFAKMLNYLNNSNIKKVCSDIALKVILDGAYYGYQVDSANSITLQELPIGYCRSRFYYGATPAVEFNMRFFDDKFQDISQRLRVIKMFPAEFAKGYMLYK
jgi:hypothetical protein